jgi:coenzyme F420-0:L-glutamate ligase/coenzyme F420-1:gamma-L-glutamate ligase
MRFPDLVHYGVHGGAGLLERCCGNHVIRPRPLFCIRHLPGIDRSNLEPQESERVLLLPENPDASCVMLQSRLQQHFGVRLALIINDSFGRAWRNGTVGVALGAAGLPALLDLRGHKDLYGRELQVTEIGFADEIPAAASLVMGQAAEAQPLVKVSGLSWDAEPNVAGMLLRPRERDLFR